MSLVNPIADLLTRIRNALHKKFKTTMVPKSKIKVKILEILKNEGFILNFKEIKKNQQPQLKIFLKYVGDEEKSVINNIQMISKSGRRIYAGKDELPYIMGGYGIAIISTSKGIMTDSEARKQGIGGEVLCEVS